LLHKVIYIEEFNIFYLFFSFYDRNDKEKNIKGIYENAIEPFQYWEILSHVSFGRVHSSGPHGEAGRLSVGSAPAKLSSVFIPMVILQGFYGVSSGGCPAFPKEGLGFVDVFFLSGCTHSSGRRSADLRQANLQSAG